MLLNYIVLNKLFGLIKKIKLLYYMKIIYIFEKLIMIKQKNILKKLLMMKKMLKIMNVKTFGETSLYWWKIIKNFFIDYILVFEK